MPDALARLTGRLLVRGDVPASQVSSTTRRAWRSLLETGALAEERRGAGRVLRVRKPHIVEEWMRTRYPDTCGVGGAHPPARAWAVATVRNAKRARRIGVEPVLLRATKRVVCRRDGLELDLHVRTEETGVVSLLVETDRHWSFSAHVAIVENLEVFLYAERLGGAMEVALYAGGRLSQQVLNWLASPELAGCTFVHYGDYDPVGLDEYTRLQNVLGVRVALYVPENLPQLIRTYGRPELLRDAASIWHRVHNSRDPAVQRVVGLLDETGCGLEQEVLLFGAPPDQVDSCS